MDRLIFQHNGPEILEALRRRNTDTLQRVDQAIGRGAHEIARDAVERMPKFRSRTAAATGVDHPAPLHWEIGFGTRWAIDTERGTGPGGRPTLAETMDWIRLRGITPDTPGMSRESLAFLIRRKIARRGVPAQPYAEPALRAHRTRLSDLVRGAARAGMGSQA